MQTVQLNGIHLLAVRDARGAETEAALVQRYRRMLVLTPVAKQKDYGPLELTASHSEERGTSQGRERIHWKVLTDLPVRSCADAIEKLQWNALRMRPTECPPACR